MSQVADWSFDTPDIPALIDHGYAGRLRYIATRNRSTQGKLFTPAEAAQHPDWPFGLVWEVGTDWTSWDGAEADRQADAVGLGSDRPIFWAVDRDIAAGDYPLVARMLDGVDSRRPRGLYLEASGVEWCMSHGAAQWGWISSAYGWSSGGRPYTAAHAKEQAPDAHLCQLLGAPFPGIDVNDVMRDDWGQNTPGVVDVPLSQTDLIEVTAAAENAIRVMNGVSLDTSPEGLANILALRATATTENAIRVMFGCSLDASPEQLLDTIASAVAAKVPALSGGALSDADVSRIADAVIGQLQAHPLHP